jgi:hypothetical protein
LYLQRRQKTLSVDGDNGVFILVLFIQSRHRTRQKYFIGATTKRQASKRQVSKRLVSKRPVSKRQVLKRQVYKTSGFKTSGFKTSSF